MAEVNGPRQVNINYGGNSNRQKEAAASPAEVAEERVKIEKVIDGNVIERKKGFGSKLRERFQVEDASSITSYVFWEVIVPKLTDLAFDAITEGASRTFYGDRRGPSSSSSNRARPTSYHKVYQQAPEPRTISQRARSTHDFSQEIAFPNLGSAEKVLDTLMEYIEKYGFVTVSDFYDACGISNNEFTDEKHGWDDLRSVRTRRTREGYILELPPTKQRE
jgi:hypothetical protein